MFILLYANENEIVLDLGARILNLFRILMDYRYPSIYMGIILVILMIVLIRKDKKFLAGLSFFGLIGTFLVLLANTPNFVPDKTLASHSGPIVANQQTTQQIANLRQVLKSTQKALAQRHTALEKAQQELTDKKQELEKANSQVQALTEKQGEINHFFDVLGQKLGLAKYRDNGKEIIWPKNISSVDDKAAAVLAATQKLKEEDVSLKKKIQQLKRPRSTKKSPSDKAVIKKFYQEVLEDSSSSYKTDNLPKFIDRVRKKISTLNRKIVSERQKATASEQGRQKAIEHQNQLKKAAEKATQALKRSIAAKNKSEENLKKALKQLQAKEKSESKVIHQFQVRISQLKARVQTLEQQNKIVGQHNQQLAAKNRLLNQQKENLKKEKKHLNDQIKKQAEATKRLQQIVKNKKQKISSLQAKGQEQQKLISALKIKSAPPQSISCEGLFPIYGKKSLYLSCSQEKIIIYQDKIVLKIISSKIQDQGDYFLFSPNNKQKVKINKIRCSEWDVLPSPLNITELEINWKFVGVDFGNQRLMIVIDNQLICYLGISIKINLPEKIKTKFGQLKRIKCQRIKNSFGWEYQLQDTSRKVGVWITNGKVGANFIKRASKQEKNAIKTAFQNAASSIHVEINKDGFRRVIR